MTFCCALSNLTDGFGNLSSLKHLHMSRCMELISLPDNFGSLSNLLQLDLRDCTQLTRLRNSFSKLLSLQKLQSDVEISIWSVAPNILHSFSNPFIDKPMLPCIISTCRYVLQNVQVDVECHVFSPYGYHKCRSQVKLDLSYIRFDCCINRV